MLQGITRTLDGADTAPLLPKVRVPTLIPGAYVFERPDGEAAR
jgi:hypothetical protein